MEERREGGISLINVLSKSHWEVYENGKKWERMTAGESG